MTKFKFDMSLMGKEVIVTNILERKVEGNNRFWESKEVEEKRVGWVVGYSWCCNGVYKSGSSCYTYSGEDDYNSPYLDITSKTPCILVTYWPNQKPIKIPIDGFVEYDVEILEHALLKPYSSSGYGSGIDRLKMIELTRKIVKDGVNRDSKGRFIR